MCEDTSRMKSISVILLGILWSSLAWGQESVYNRSVDLVDLDHVPKIHSETNSCAPEFKWESSHLESAVVKMIKKDDYLVGVWINGLCILKDMEIVSKLYFEDGWTTGLDIVGDLAYTTSEGGTVRAIDVSDPYNPVVVGSYRLEHATRGVDVRDNIAYVGFKSGLASIDWSDLSHPRLLDTVGFRFLPQDVVLHGSTAYVPAYALYAVDISDPASLGIRDSLYDELLFRSLCIRDSVIYTAESSWEFPTWDAGFGTLDLELKRLSSHRLNGLASGVMIQDSLAFVSNRDFGLLVYDISDPSAPDSLTSWDGAGHVGYTFIDGDSAWVLDYGTAADPETVTPPPSDTSLSPGDIQLLDITDPLNPSRLAYTPLRKNITEVAIARGVTYGANNNYFSHSVEVVGGQRVPLDAEIYDIKPWRGFLMCATAKGLEVLDISSPFQPTRVASMDSGLIADISFYQDTILVAAARYEGVWFVDIADPLDPHLIGGFRTYNGRYMTVPIQTAIRGDICYVADQCGSFKVFKIRLPEAIDVTPPDLAKPCPDFGYSDLDVGKSYLWANSHLELEVYDLSNPEHPVLVDGLYFPFRRDVHAIDDMCVLSGGIYGFGIYGLVAGRLHEHWRIETPGYCREVFADTSGQQLVVADNWSLIRYSREDSSATNGTVPRPSVLSRNYPNPFNPRTTIEFEIPRSGHLKLDIINILGQRVETIIDEPRNAGRHSVSWDGSGHASGVYFYRLEVGKVSTTKKMLLLK